MDTTWTLYPSEIVDLVGLDPAGVPVRVLPPRINLVRGVRGVSALTISVVIITVGVRFVSLHNPLPRIDSFGLCAEIIVLKTLNNIAEVPPLICGVPLDEVVHVGVDNHHHDDDVEGVEEPHVDHLDVGRLGNHLIDRGLDGGNHHHRGDGDHYSVLEHREGFLSDQI